MRILYWGGIHCFIKKILKALMLILKFVVLNANIFFGGGGGLPDSNQIYKIKKLKNYNIPPR